MKHSTRPAPPPNKRPVTKHDGRPRSQFQDHTHGHRAKKNPVYMTPAACNIPSTTPEAQKLALCAAFSNVTTQETASLRIEYTGVQIGSYQRQLSAIVANKDRKPFADIVKEMTDLLVKYENSPYVILRQVFLMAGLERTPEALRAKERYDERCNALGIRGEHKADIERALTRS